MSSAAPPARPTSPANQVRQNAKWLIAAFAAVGAALAAGIQISNIGAIHSVVRLLAAACGAALGLIGIILAVWHAGNVLDLQEATTSQLVEGDPLKDHLKREPTFLGGFGHKSVKELISDYEEALRDMRVAQRATWDRPYDEVAATRLKSIEAEFDELSKTVEFLRGVFIYNATKAAYSKARPQIVVGALVAFLGLGIFAYAANPPEQKPAASTVIVGTMGSPGPRGPRGFHGKRGRPGPRGPAGPHAEGS